MNILLINHYAGSKEHGMEYRPYYFAKEWVKLGHSVTIIAASYSHVRSKQPNIQNKWNEEMIDGIKYIWIRTPEYNGNGIKRIVNMGSFVQSLFTFKNRICRTIRPDVVIASSTYPLDIYPARSISRKAKAKLIFEVHDLWPLSPMELGGMSPYHPFIITMQLAENYAYKNSDEIVSLLPNAKEHMLEHGMEPQKFNYIPNGIDLSEWEKPSEEIPKNITEKMNELKEKGHLLVGYAGSHGLANSLNSLVKASKIVEDKKISIILVGKGPEKDNLRKLAQEEKVTNIYFFDAIPKSSIPNFLTKMDILYIGLQRQSLFRFGISPNKLFDYMMARKPVIQAIDAGNDLVAESECGISVEPENSNAIAEGIMILANKTSEERNKIGENGYKYILQNHIFKILAEKFLEVMGK